ncbi:hypothetical protein UlMin_035751 [Ulmus minor]
MKFFQSFKLVSSMFVSLVITLTFKFDIYICIIVFRVTDNPADQLVDVINKNRTAHKSSSLHSNPGLACIALEYIHAYKGDCSAVGGSDAKKPADSQFAETFAPECGVEVSTLSPISGRFLGCQSKYTDPSTAFSSILIQNQKSMDILYSKNHTEVGAAVSGAGPYFWCVLFSNGKSNSSFVLKNGVARIIKPGCFSGTDDVCSSASDWSQSSRLWTFFVAGLLAATYVFGL